MAVVKEKFELMMRKLDGQVWKWKENGLVENSPKHMFASEIPPKSDKAKKSNIGVKWANHGEQNI